MFRIQILVLLILISIGSFGQKANDVLYLSNGSIIKGKIVGKNDSTVLIETCCGSIFAYDYKEIINVGQEEKEKQFKAVEEKGYLNFSSIGILLGSTSNAKQAPLSLLTEHNYRIHKYIAAGAVSGYELLNESTIPLAANFKLMLPLNSSTLFIGISGGYSFSVENPEPGYYSSYTGGGLFNIELGTVMPLSQNSAFFIAVGYRYNTLHYKYNYWWAETVNRTYYYNRISIRIGLAMY
jgi:hypothetical protein